MLDRPDKPDFERFLTTIKGGHSDRVPIAEALIDNRIKAAILGKPILNLSDDVAFWEKAGYDFICLPSGILDPGQTVSSDRPLGTRGEQYGDEDLHIQMQWADETVGQITRASDLEVYSWPSIEDLVPLTLTQVAHYLPERMKVIVTTGKIFTATWQLMGFETFCTSIYDNFKLVERVFDLVIRLQMEAYKRICEIDTVGGFWFSDDIAYAEGMMVSPTILRKFVFPTYARMVDMAHNVGKIAIFHSDGQLWKVLDDIVSCGFDALHPIEPKAMNIMEVRSKTEGRLSLIGNIDLDYPLTTGNPEDVRALVYERIKTLAPSGGYIVGSSNSIPDWVPVSNYVSMIQAVFDYGRYPIDLN